jgi:hypothetical protein
LVVTPYVLTEACYLVAKYIGADAEVNLEAVAAGDLSQAEIDPAGLSRIADLIMAVNVSVQQLYLLGRPVPADSVQLGQDVASQAAVGGTERHLA